MRWLVVGALLLGGCFSAALPPPDIPDPHIPDRPTLEAKMGVGSCEGLLVPDPDRLCVTIYLPDWDRIRLYYHTLEREVRTLCLELGKSDQTCKIR